MRYQVFNEQSSTKPVFAAPWRWVASWYCSTVAIKFDKCRLVDSKSGETLLDWARAHGCTFPNSQSKPTLEALALMSGTRMRHRTAFLVSSQMAHMMFRGTTGKGMSVMEKPSIEQVKALDGRIFAMLNTDEEAVLNFYRDQGRKYGVSVSIINEADPDELTRASLRQQTDQILKRTNSLIHVTVDQ